MKLKHVILTILIFWATISFAQTTTTYQYDSHNSLVSSTDGNTTVQYSFDQLGNRTKYTVTSSAGQQADLLVQNINAPSTIGQGEVVSVSCDVSNTGTANASGSYLKVYLANTSTGIDTELKSTYISSILVGQTESLSFDITIPNNTDTGDKYLVFFADAKTSISEPNENNNKANVQVTVQAQTLPDLTIQNQQATPASVTAGENITISAEIANTGVQQAGDFLIKCHLSLNPTFESYNDIEITNAEYNCTTLNAGTTLQYSKTVNIPANTIPDIYYLLLVADTENVIAEQNEQNNIAFTTLIITNQNSNGIAPIANFSTDNQFIGTGTTVQFTDISSNNPTSWQWSFPGGTPNYSTAQTPSVMYSSNGKYDVTLITANGSGASTISKNELISVSDDATATITVNTSTTFCKDGYVGLSANTGEEFTYQWLKNGNYINGATESTYHANTDGDYQVEIINQENFLARSDVTTVNPLPTAIIRIKE